MTFPGSVLDLIEDDFYMYYQRTGEECVDIQWCGYTVVMTLPEQNTKGNIEIYKEREDVTPCIFPDKEIDKGIPATTHNLFGVLTLLYKRSKKK